jgi:TolB protein
MKKITLIAAIIFSVTAFAQEMKVHKTNGDVELFLLSQIDSITFTTSNSSSFIVFNRYVNSNLQVFKANLDGSGVINLTNSAVNDHKPIISPDRSKIGFASDRNGQCEVFTMDINGNNPQQITTNGCLGGQYGNGFGSFDWLPNNKIVYTNGNLLFTINLDGTDLTQIATSPSGSYFNFVVTSPDGSKIAASTMKPWAYDVEIYLMNNDGTNMTLLVPDNPGMTNVCSFTSDGSKVVYFYDVSGNEVSGSTQLDAHIFLINLDGTNNTDISINKPSGYNDYFSSIHPDGNKVIFSYQVNTYVQNADVWIMNIDGSDRNQLFTDGFYLNCK